MVSHLPVDEAVLSHRDGLFQMVDDRCEVFCHVLVALVLNLKDFVFERLSKVIF